jgi:hypothetical protein
MTDKKRQLQTETEETDLVDLHEHTLYFIKASKQ